MDDSDSADVEAASTELCASSDPDYEFEVTPRFDLALLWAVTDGGNSVKVKVRSPSIFLLRIFRSR